MIRPRSALFEYQSGIAIPAFKERPECAAFMGVGTGKTISAATSLLDRGMPKTLVVAPKRVARRVWSEELAAWAHTQDVRVNVLQCEPAQRLIRLNHRSDIDVIGYDLFPWLTETINLNKRYGAVVWDEVQKMKSAKAVRFKAMRYRAMGIPIRIGLTGNPVGNKYSDLWGEMFAVAGAKPLGNSRIQFLMQYFTAYEVANNGRSIPAWALNYGAAELIHARIKPYAFSLDPAIGNKWPVRYNEIHVDLPKSVEKMSEELARDLRTWLASGAELIALSGSTRAQKVRQMAGGAVYYDLDRWEAVHTEKLDALEDLVDELQGEPLLVGYWYKHELQRLLERFPDARTIRTIKDEDDWNARKIEVGFIHPASAGEGINLQKGGYNFCWYTLPWSWLLQNQTQGRLPRPGQECDHVMVHCLLGGATDRYVLGYLRDQEKQDRETKAAVQI